MKTKLTIELVPAGQWGDNLRSRIPKSQWDKLRKKQYKKAHHRCEICRGKGPKWPVECHEIWHYDEQKKIQRLDGLIALCPKCHLVKHMGRALSIGQGDIAKKHLMKVNGWSKSDVELYLEVVFEVWYRRNRSTWSLDLTWLDNQGE